MSASVAFSWCPVTLRYKESQTWSLSLWAHYPAGLHVNQVLKYSGTPLGTVGIGAESD